MTTVVGGLDNLERRLHELANAQFDSDEYRRFFSLTLNEERARIYIVQRSYFVLNRRDCWAYVQAAAPFDVKQMIWDHEREELMGDPDRDLENHYRLGVKEGAAVGLTPEDFTRIPPLPGTAVCCYAWIHLAKDRPWLEALPVCAATEMSNSDEILAGGSFSRRVGEMMHRDLGIPLKDQPSNAEHVVAEIEHARLLMRAARKHAQSEAAQQQILKGATETWRIERVFKGVLADAMAACPD